VSVVIPCYNQAHFLGEAIESVLAQSHQDFEVIVVDDGSTDDTAEVAARYPKVRLIRQENRGLAGARNRGLSRSAGEYVVFLDADDRLLPEALEAGLECFSAHPECALVSGHSRFIAADGSLLGLGQLPPQLPHIGKDIYVTILSRAYFILPGAVMYRRSVFETVSWFDPAVSPAADYDLYMRIARKFPVYFHDKVVLEYRRHDASMTRNPGKMLEPTIAVLRRQRAYAKKNSYLRRAYRTGIKRGREEYGVPLVWYVRTRLREGEWKRAVGGAYLLLRYYPKGLALLFSGEKRQLREALEKERREVRRLKKRNRQLASRAQALEKKAQNMEQRLQEIEGSRAWRALKKLRRFRGGSAV
jgi:glycosyltransferase involved in cell wall biosynthesis